MKALCQCSIYVCLSVLVEEGEYAAAVKERPQGDDRNEAMRWQWLYMQSS